jgi:hypothetical protein
MLPVSFHARLQLLSDVFQVLLFTGGNGLRFFSFNQLPHYYDGADDHYDFG